MKLNKKELQTEMAAMDAAKAKEDKKKANAEKMKDWKHPR
jgi:hypothetical protein